MKLSQNGISQLRKVVKSFVQTIMIKIIPDNRKFNALLLMGILLVGMTYFTKNSITLSTSIWFVGIIFILIALLNRHIIIVEKECLIIKNRVNLFSKTIPLSEIVKIKVVDRESTGDTSTILHLFLWDKKFRRFKEINLFNQFNEKLFRIDGQAITNNDFAKLIRVLRK